MSKQPNIALGAILLLIFLYHTLSAGNDYFRYKKAVSGKQPVQYDFVKIAGIRSGKSPDYFLWVRYQDKTYHIKVDKDYYKKFDTNQLPDIYYVQNSDELTTKWHVTNALHLLLFLSSITGVVVLILMVWLRDSPSGRNP